VQQRLDHRRVGLGEQRADERQQRLGVRAARGDVAGGARVEHRDEALGAQVGGGGDRALAAHQYRGEQVGVVAAEHREALRLAGQHGQRVGVQGADGLLEARDVLGRRDLEQPRGAQAAPGAVGHVVDDERHRRALRHRPEVSDDAGLRGSDVVGHDRQRRADARHGGQRLVAADRLARVVGARADDEVGAAVGAHPRGRRDHRVALGGVQRGRLAGRRQRDEAGGARIQQVGAEALERVEVDGAVGGERRDDRRQQAGRAVGGGHPPILGGASAAPGADRRRPQRRAAEAVGERQHRVDHRV
jgi:hypothetical protein